MMSDETTQPEQTTAAPEPSRADKLKDAARGALKLAPKGVPAKPAPAKVEAKVEAIEAAGEVAPEQKAGETDQRYEQRLAETLRKLQKIEGEAVTHRKRGDDLEREWGPVKSLIAATKGDPARIPELLDLAGYTPDQVAQFMIDGKIKRTAPKAQLPPEVQARIDALEAAAAKLKEREDAEAQQNARNSDMQAIEGSLAELKAELPFMSSLPGAKDRVYATLLAQYEKTGETPDLAGELRRAEAAVASDMKALLNEHTIKALATDESIRATIITALGLQPAPEPSKHSPVSERKGSTKHADGPRTLSLNVTSEVPARTTDKPTKAEREARVRTAARGVLGLK